MPSPTIYLLTSSQSTLTETPGAMLECTFGPQSPAKMTQKIICHAVYNLQTVKLVDCSNLQIVELVYNHWPSLNFMASVYIRKKSIFKQLYNTVYVPTIMV